MVVYSLRVFHQLDNRVTSLEEYRSYSSEQLASQRGQQRATAFLTGVAASDSYRLATPGVLLYSL